MKETFNFLFVIDVSGSMYGQKIAAVNASLTECLAELRQIGASANYDIKVNIATFAEKMQLHILNEKPENIGAPHIKVEPQTDGFYSVTSFTCLYKGLKYLFENKKIMDKKQGKNTFVFLFSDAKPVDGNEYKEVLDSIQQCVEFKNSIKYVGFVEDEMDKYNKYTIRFVDYKADQIVRVSEIPGEIRKLQMTFFSDQVSQIENARYDQIFV